MSALPTPTRLSLDAARDLTEEVKADAAALWAKLLTLYEGEAHITLGYSSWSDYCAEEFDLGKVRSYQLLNAARVVESVHHGELEPPQSERVAREMAPVFKDDGPEAVEEVWGEVVQEHGPNPTALQVREKVQERKDPEPGIRKSNQQSRLLAGIWQQADNILMVKDSLDLEIVKSLPQEEKDQCRQSLSEARTVITRILGAL